MTCVWEYQIKLHPYIDILKNNVAHEIHIRTFIIIIHTYAYWPGTSIAYTIVSEYVV